jgi:hypothetical protein
MEGAPHVGRPGTGVRAADIDPLGAALSTAADVVPEALDVEVADKVGRVLERLGIVEEAERVGREVAVGPVRERLAVVAVLEDEGEAVKLLGEPLDDARVEEGQPVGARCLAAIDDKDGAAGLVVRGVVPIALAEGVGVVAVDSGVGKVRDGLAEAVGVVRRRFEGQRDAAGSEEQTGRE